MRLTIILLIAFISYTLSSLGQTNESVKESTTKANVETRLTSRKYEEIYGKWFYMPSFPIDFSVTGNQIINLYTQYANQYKNANPAYVIPQDMLNFYIIGFDEDIFEISPSINTSHEIKYKIKSVVAKRSKSAYITIIGVIK